MEKFLSLKQKIIATTSSIPHSRVHKLKSLTTSQTECFVKRDDELGGSINGTKWRKYTSLIPFLLHHNYKEVIVIGGAYSNHVLGISQLLIENQIKPLLFLLGDSKTKRIGNAILTSLLVPESQIEWISRKEWPDVERRAQESIQKNSRSHAFVLPEGAMIESALPGALTLALDIEEEYDHIFIDAGTGLSAIATILAYAWLQRKSLLHILLLADEENQFLEKLERFHKSFEQYMGQPLERNKIMSCFKLYRPKKGRSFGSVPSNILSYIGFLAREEGFFTDPIYSAKLFWEAKEIITSKELKGKILLIHSGGALTLMGFQDRLATLFKNIESVYKEE